MANLLHVCYDWGAALSCASAESNQLWQTTATSISGQLIQGQRL